MVNESEQIRRIMQGIGCSEEEAKEIYRADREIDHDQPQDFDLPPEKLKVAQKFAHTGTRKMKETGLNLKPRKRKENVQKQEIIAEIARFIAENASFSAENLEIPNKERIISFQVGEEKYELTLTQKRKPKK